MDEVVSRSRVMAQKGFSVRLPVAHMVCNQTPPVGDKPSLMTFREVNEKISFTHVYILARHEISKFLLADYTITLIYR